MCVLRWCPESSTVAVSDVESCTMTASSLSCASAGPSEPTAPTQAQHVARWNDEAEILADAASCTMAAASSSCASAGPSEPTAPTQALHVARWIDVAEIPTWARLRGSSDCHSVCKHSDGAVCVE